MAVEFVAYADLVKKVGSARVIELFDDDRDGTIAASSSDEEALDEALEEANDTAISILKGKGYGLEQLELLQTDKHLRRQVAWIALAIGGERRPEFRDADGLGPYEAQRELAEQRLSEFARGELRSKKEDVAGINPVIVGDVNAGCPRFIFNRDPNDPGAGPGGF